MVGTVGRPDNHNLTGRFNEPYATYLHPILPSDGHLIIRDTRTLDLPSTPTTPTPVAGPRPFSSHHRHHHRGWNRWPASSSSSTTTAAAKRVYTPATPSSPIHPPSHVLVSILNRRRDGREIIKTYNGIEIVSLSINAIHRLCARMGRGREGGRVTLLHKPPDRFNLVSRGHV